jgi:hypothetical protein
MIRALAIAVFNDVPLFQSCRFNKPETITKQTIVFPTAQAIPPLGKPLRSGYTALVLQELYLLEWCEGMSTMSQLNLC